MTKSLPNVLTSRYLLAVVTFLFVSATAFGQSNNNDTIDVRFANGAYDCSADSFFVDVQVRNNSDNSIFLGGLTGRFQFDTAVLSSPFVRNQVFSGSHGTSATTTLGGEIVYTYSFIQLFYSAPVPNDNQWKTVATLGFEVLEYDSCFTLDWRKLGEDAPPITTANENEDEGGFLPSSYNLFVDEHQNFSACFDTICNFPPDVMDPFAGGNTSDTFNVSIVNGDDTLICFPVTDQVGDQWVNDTINPTAIDGPAAGLGTVAISNDTCLTYTAAADTGGQDILIYTVCDEKGLCDSIVLIIDVLPPNEPPVWANVPDSSDAGDTVSVTVNEDDSATYCYLLLDPEGDSTYANASVTAGSGAVSLVQNDDTVCVTYTPGTNDSTDAQITLIGCDSLGLCDTLVIVVDIIPQNDPPVILNPDSTDPGASVSITLPEDGDTTLCYLMVDIDGDAVTPSVSAANGSASVASQNGDTVCITYNAAANDTNDDVITLIGCDPSNACDTLTINVNIVPQNDPPVILNPDSTDAGDTVMVTSPEDSVITLCYLVADLDGDSTFATASAGSGSTSTTMNGDTVCITYTPAADDTTTDVITLIGCDVNGACDTLQIVIDLTPVNDPPVILNPDSTDPGTTVSITLPEDGDTTLCYLMVDIDGDAVTPSVSAANGSASVASQNGDTVCITYNAAVNDTNDDVITLIGCDPSNACDTLTINVNIVPQNDPPVILNQDSTDAGDTVMVTSPEDSTTTLCYLVADLDGDSTFATASAGSGSTSTTMNGDTVCITYTPAADDTTTDVITLIGCDVNGACDTLQIVIDLTPVNDPPVILNPDNSDPGDSVTVSIVEDSVTVLCYLITDVDGDVTTGTVSANLGSTSTTMNGDTICITYTPNNGDTTTDVITLIGCDPSNECDTLTIVIDISPINDPPIAVTDVVLTSEDNPVTGNVLNNDIDVEGDDLMVDTAAVQGPDNGTLVINPDGSFDYTPDPGFVGTDSFTYVVCDNGSPMGCDTGVAYIEVAPIVDPNVDNPPIAVNDVITGIQGATALGNILANDLEPDGDPLIINTTPISGPAVGSVLIDGAGNIAYVPPVGFSGTVTFTYSVCDDLVPSANDCDTATVTIEILPLPDLTGNDTPVALDDVIGGYEDNVISGNILNNDVDPDGDSLIINTTPVTNPMFGTVVINPDGSVDYTPGTNFNGMDMFDYVVCDTATPALCDTATVTINVLPVNDAPIAINDVLVTSGTNPVSGNVLGNDLDIEGDSLSVDTAATQGPSNGTVTLNPDGSITYTPDAGFVGTDSLTYVACDNGNPVLCDTATVYFEVTPPADPNANDAPIAINDVLVGQQDQPLSGDLLANDIDPDGDSLVINTTPVTAPAVGSLTINADGTIDYTPPAGFNGTVTFSYEVCDTAGLCDTALVTLEIVPVPVNNMNDAPIALDDNFTGDEDMNITGNVLNNDFDPDGDPLTVNTTPLNGPTNGSVTLGTDGSMTYVPNTDFNGTDMFSYVVCDTATPTLCDTALVTITVLPVNDAPIIDTSGTPVDEITVLVTQGDTVDITFGVKDPDLPNDSVFCAVIDSGSNGTLTIDTTHINYVLDAGFTGTDTIVKIACDTAGLCDTVMIYVQVQAGILQISPRVYLQGPFNDDNDTMRTDLNTFCNVIPTQHPYNTTPWNYAGPDSVTSFDAGVVDWVLVSARNGIFNANTITMQAALLYKDGYIRTVDGDTVINVEFTPGDSIHIVVEHRNHMGAMTADPILNFSTSVLVTDFRYMQSFKVGFGPIQSAGQIIVGTDNNTSAPLYALYAGDAIKTGAGKNDINSNDLTPLLGGFGVFGLYTLGDHDLNCDQNSNDLPFVINNQAKTSVVD